MAQKALEFVISTPSGEVCRLRETPELIDAAREWSLRARNRYRWNTDPGAYETLASKIRQDLRDLGMTVDGLKSIARHRVVEVSAAGTQTPLGTSGSRVPWEFVLPAAAYIERSDQPLVVVRRMPVRAASSRPRELPIERLLVITSGPGKLRDYYDFDSEGRLVNRGLRVPTQQLNDPTLEDVEKTVDGFHPDIVHLSGVDLHQGSQLLGSPPPPEDHSGAFFKYKDSRFKNGEPIAFDDSRIAEAIVRGQPPAFVGLNFYHSAGLAAELVRRGAGAALGFFESIDDVLAETFFYHFYSSLRRRSLLQAFAIAFEALQPSRQDLLGAGVVLWSQNPLFVIARGRARRASPSRPDPSDAPAIIVPEGGEEGLPPYELTIKPRTHLNYSLLHNRRGLFERFELKKFSAEPVENVNVEVKLFVGEHPYPYRRTLTLTEPITSLNHQIAIPLMWITQLHHTESVLTNIQVSVGIGDEREVSDYQVQLLPADEWVDDDLNRQWLPSFVLPRDAAVSDVITAAEKLLPALADRAFAGFDGYQSIDLALDDPYAGVDCQVQAIWAALSLQRNLRYVNPPPSYTKLSQRLRSPSQILREGRGTCIDLALLLAACLEYIEIHATIFLIEGHAFAGYWRSTEFHDEFLKLASDPDPLSEQIPWMVHTEGYDQVLKQISDGRLVPLEATLMTESESFHQAIEEGYSNLRTRDEFHSLIDLAIAREKEVRPLPLEEIR